MFDHLDDPSPPEPGQLTLDSVISEAKRRSRRLLMQRILVVGVASVLVVAVIAQIGLPSSGRKTVTTQLAESPTFAATDSDATSTPESTLSTTAQDEPTPTPDPTPTAKERPRVEALNWSGADDSLSVSVEVRPGTPRPGETTTFRVTAHDSQGGWITGGVCFGDRENCALPDGAQFGCRSNPSPSPRPPSSESFTYEHQYSEPGTYNVVMQFNSSACYQETRGVRIAEPLEVY